MTAAHVLEVTDGILRSEYTHGTKVVRCGALRRVLRYLWEYHGAEKLDGIVGRKASIRPRNVVVRQDEKDLLLTAAPKHLKLWILLCSDLAIRSGTATRLGPEHYDARQQRLTYTTKMQEKQSVQVTAEIAALLDECEMENSESFVQQLWHKAPCGPQKRSAFASNSLNASFRRLCKREGIERRITPHDFRRTTALRLYKHTRDLQQVQGLLGHFSMNSTLWYLDHGMRQVSVDVLEELKKPFIVRKEKTA